MYVTLYDDNVHPGVNMLLGMGALVGSGDKPAIAAAGDRIQDWAEDASKRIASLVVEVRAIMPLTCLRLLCSQSHAMCGVVGLFKISACA